MIPLAAFAMAGCLGVGADADRILARDLAPFFPALAAAAPEYPLSPAPAPGVARIFRAPELHRLAARWNLQAPAGEVCFARPLAPPDPGRILAAMQQQLPGAHIQILDVSRLPAPEGVMDFPLAGLKQLPVGGIWGGWVRYAGGHRFPIWARVSVLAKAPRIVATEELKPGRAVTAAQLRLEMRDEFPTGGVFATTIEELAGGTPRRLVPAGTPLRRQWIAPAMDVAHGDTVKVEVRSGGAMLELEAQAEASGSTGDVIPLRNPLSKRRFLGRVTGAGRVSVEEGKQ